jgi:hypothetical protein
MNQPGHTFIMDGKVVRNWDETRLLLITRDSVTGELRTEEVSADTLRTVREQVLSHTYMENVRHDEPSGD